MNNILPETILEQAYELYLNGEYKQSLKKYEWFFDNADKIDSCYDGAKYRSLKEWYCLSRKYPPAHDALVERKNLAYKLYKKNISIKTFRDYVKICLALNDDNEAIDLFLSIHQTNRSFAKDIYKYMEETLVKNKYWELCSLYIENSLQKYSSILAKFDELIKISESGFNGEYNSIYEKQFEKDIKNLLWILKVGKRDKEINNLMVKVKVDMRKRGIDIS